MDDRNEKIAAALERLFRTYPQSDRGDALDVALERMERAKIYFDALAQYDLRDIEIGIAALISGSAPGVNPNFIPPAPVVAGEVRRQMGLRHHREDIDRIAQPKLAPPDVERTPESQARVRELMNRTVAGLRGMTEKDSAEADARRKALWDRTNASFDAERGYSIGDPEDAADAA